MPLYDDRKVDQTGRTCRSKSMPVPLVTEATEEEESGMASEYEEGLVISPEGYYSSPSPVSQRTRSPSPSTSSKCQDNSCRSSTKRSQNASPSMKWKASSSKYSFQKWAWYACRQNYKGGRQRKLHWGNDIDTLPLLETEHVLYLGPCTLCRQFRCRFFHGVTTNGSMGIFPKNFVETIPIELSCEDHEPSKIFFSQKELNCHLVEDHFFQWIDDILPRNSNCPIPNCNYSKNDRRELIYHFGGVFENLSVHTFSHLKILQHKMEKCVMTNLKKTRNKVERNLECLRKDNQELIREKDGMSKQITTIKGICSDLEKRNLQLEEELNQSKEGSESMEQLQRTISNLMGRINTLETEKKNLSIKNDPMLRERDKNPHSNPQLVKSEIIEHERRKPTDQEITLKLKLKSQGQIFESRIEDLQRQIKELEAKLDDVSMQREQMNKLLQAKEESIETRNNELEKIKEEKWKAEDRCIRWRKKNDNDINVRQAKLNAYHEEMNALRIALESEKNSKEQHEAQLRRLAKDGEEFQKLRKDNQSLNEENKGLQAHLHILQEKLKKVMGECSFNDKKLQDVKSEFQERKKSLKMRIEELKEENTGLSNKYEALYTSNEDVCTDLESKNTNLTKQISELSVKWKSEQTSLNEKLREKELQIDQLNDQKKKYLKKLSALKYQVVTMKSELREIKGLQSDKEAKLESLNKDLEERKCQHAQELQLKCQEIKTFQKLVNDLKGERDKTLQEMAASSNEIVKLKCQHEQIVITLKDELKVSKKKCGNQIAQDQEITKQNNELNEKVNKLQCRNKEAEEINENLESQLAEIQCEIICRDKKIEDMEGKMESQNEALQKLNEELKTWRSLGSEPAPSSSSKGNDLSKRSTSLKRSQSYIMPGPLCSKKKRYKSSGSDS